MKKSTIADEQIFALIDENKTNAEIARTLGVKQTNINTRINKLRVKHEFNLNEAKKKAESKQEPPQKKAAPTSPFPFKRGDFISYGGKMHTVVRAEADRLVLRDIATLNSKFFSPADYEKNKAAFIKKGTDTPDEKPAKKPVDDLPKVTAGDVKVNGQPIKNLPDTVKEKIVEKLIEAVPTSESSAKALDGRKPAAINQDFEAAFSNEVPTEKSVEDLFESASNNEQPLHIDLEMENSTEPLKPFADIDYTDSEWGAAERDISEIVTGFRDYLDKIDQLLDVMMPCSGAELDDTVRLAMGILGRGIRKEAGV